MVFCPFAVIENRKMIKAIKGYFIWMLFTCGLWGKSLYLRKSARQENIHSLNVVLVLTDSKREHFKNVILKKCKAPIMTELKRCCFFLDNFRQKGFKRLMFLFSYRLSARQKLPQE